jgi:hypothetical protein
MLLVDPSCRVNTPLFVAGSLGFTQIATPAIPAVLVVVGAVMLNVVPFSMATTLLKLLG